MISSALLVISDIVNFIYIFSISKTSARANNGEVEQEKAPSDKRTNRQLQTADSLIIVFIKVYYRFMKNFKVISNRVHATLQPALSVCWSVSLLVRHT